MEEELISKTLNLIGFLFLLIGLFSGFFVAHGRHLVKFLVYHDRHFTDAIDLGKATSEIFVTSNLR